MQDAALSTSRRYGGDHCRRLGNAAERRVLFILRRESRPWWIASVRRATQEEDRDGIDVVVCSTDVGEIPIQVKSSAKEAQRFRAREAQRGRVGAIAVVVASRLLDDATLYGRALAALILWREAHATTQGAK